MILFFSLIFSLYGITILALVYGFSLVKTPKVKVEKTSTTFTVIIPFKDEAFNLPLLFQSISNLDFPKHLVEFILVNDNSEDHSVKLAEDFISKSSFQIKLIHSLKISASPKKEALTTAIHKAKHEWIITSDADCSFGPEWLKTYDAFIQTHTYKFIAGPVAYSPSSRLFHKFQQLDFSSLIGVTIGSFGLKNPIMCNGANLAFKASFFKALNGYHGNTTIASGDDVFLLEKAVKSNKTQVAYLKHNAATVYTKPVNTLKQLVAQRIRWGSKTSKSSIVLPKLLGLLVLITNALCLLSFLSISILTPTLVLFYWSLKIVVDALLIYKTLHFFNQANSMKFYVICALLYPFFTVYIAILSLFGGYKWKNRAYKR